MTKNAKQPNSFVYRFVPKQRDDLTKGGKLQVLQAVDAYGDPIIFHKDDVNGDILSAAQKLMYGYGNELLTHWVTIRDSDKDPAETFDANALAKAANATPFKRPENGQFRPGIKFAEFQSAPGADKGRLSIVIRGDVAHTGFDNLTFLDDKQLLVVEDAGDKLHSQRNAYDSAYDVDVTADYASKDPVHFLAQARDDMATIDSGYLGQPGYQNEGDNEITGMHVSDGNPTVEGLIGTAVPTPFENGWRVFYTRQHGRNTTFEIVKAK